MMMLKVEQSDLQRTTKMTMMRWSRHLLQQQIRAEAASLMLFVSTRTGTPRSRKRMMIDAFTLTGFTSSPVSPGGGGAGGPKGKHLKIQHGH